MAQLTRASRAFIDACQTGLLFAIGSGIWLNLCRPLPCERFADLTTHPAFRDTARTIDRLHDALGDPMRKCPIEQTAASGLIYLNSHAMDFQNPEMRPCLDRYLRGSNGYTTPCAARSRTQILPPATRFSPVRHAWPRYQPMRLSPVAFAYGSGPGQRTGGAA
jgi:hypothetical protein